MTIALRSLTLVASLVFGGVAWGQASMAVSGVVSALRAGGHVIVFRHGATHPDQADTDPLNPDNIAKQRHLNDTGRADAKAVGGAFKTAGVLIGGKDPVATNDVTEGGLVVSPNENNRRAQALRAMAATAPDPGTNTLIVTHKPNILDAFGRNWFDVKEGEASIFKPDGKGESVLIARVQIGQWAAANR